MVALIVADVASRTLFDTPLRGVPEVVSLIIPGIVFLALGYLFAQDKLIASSVLLSRLQAYSPSTGAYLQFIFLLIGTAIAFAITVPSAVALYDALRDAEFIGVEGNFTVPVWPQKLALVLGSLLLAVLCVAQASQVAVSLLHHHRAKLVAFAMATLLASAGLALLQFGVESRATVGAVSIAIMFALIYLGAPVAFAIGAAAALGVAAIKSSPAIAIATLGLVADGAVSAYVFAAVPLFVLMGLIVGAADIGRDSLLASHWVLRRLRGGLGIATVAANGVFAAITGISIASAAIFSRVAVPSLIDYGFTPRFSVGLVAGSSVLGMLIPPSLLLIIYGLVAEVSINHLFLAAIVPGVLLAVLFAAGVALVSAYGVGFAVQRASLQDDDFELDGRAAFNKALPVIGLITIVLGGIYGGVFTPTEAGAVGSLSAAIYAIATQRISFRRLAGLVVESAASSASILLLIVMASAFAIMLSLSGIPSELSAYLADGDLTLTTYMLCYLLLLIILGMVLDSTSIILIMVPLAQPSIQALSGDLVWFGIVTVIGVEIGLLTPPLGLSVYAIKASLEDESISLNDIFVGAFPFTLIMLVLSVVLIVFPRLGSLY